MAESNGKGHRDGTKKLGEWVKETEGSADTRDTEIMQGIFDDGMVRLVKGMEEVERKEARHRGDGWGFRI